MEKGFIRAEVVSFEDIITYGSTVEARAKGRLRVEGKTTSSRMATFWRFALIFRV
jgi:ribosome-binding ATPase YchF (GTP1/OBG family)